jgi:xanthine dehydrogenase YagS FAD-binding subunit
LRPRRKAWRRRRSATSRRFGGNLAQRSRCWYFRNPHIACLKKGGSDCPARSGNHLYHAAFDLGPCVAPHPSTMAAALLAYEAR